MTEVCLNCILVNLVAHPLLVLDQRRYVLDLQMNVLAKLVGVLQQLQLFQFNFEVFNILADKSQA